jgi:hypothetical protein
MKMVISKKNNIVKKINYIEKMDLLGYNIMEMVILNMKNII